MSTELRDLIVGEAKRLGFHRIGIVPVEAPQRYDAYKDWLRAGYAGSMAYMAAPDHVEGRSDLRKLAEAARTVVVVASSYGSGSGNAESPVQLGTPRGFVARYARGADYHHVMKRKLYELAQTITDHLGRPVAARPCVDTAPVLERDVAERAGIGFTAKNTMVIAPGLGSYILLGELLLDVDVAGYSADASRSRCGSCRACLDACPTNAFADEYVLDARRCISYLTIEHRGAIPRQLRPAIGNMIFGCDVCQEVCPFNVRGPDKEPADTELAERPDRAFPDLIELLSLGTNQRRRYLDGTAMRRVDKHQLARNICVALGNSGDRAAIGPLRGLLTNPNPLVRSHAAWALIRLGDRDYCQQHLADDPDADVRAELLAP